ncbi:unnamed protein product [Darwinula stevensoni]|uniref:Uncharacterized protein n=1 Tax=Darwinula stevensoni TaxID=69355 RepID=A0A7R8XAL5_9CRUS|nr:unnamed protein product [Darwinula stevensoni]CAG0891495.1 unnamed protein product [Darwinula stevensoni]
MALYPNRGAAFDRVQEKAAALRDKRDNGRMSFFSPSSLGCGSCCLLSNKTMRSSASQHLNAFCHASGSLSQCRSTKKSCNIALMKLPISSYSISRGLTNHRHALLLVIQLLSRGGGEDDDGGGSPEILAWSSVQIHCMVARDDGKAILLDPSSPGSGPMKEKLTSNAATSFVPHHGERGQVIVATKPKILCCDLCLFPGESKSYIYQEQLPSNGPPSYRGPVIRYWYKLTIGTQRVGSPIRLVRIPLRVLLLQEMGFESESDRVAPSNPFLSSSHKESPLEVAMQILQNATVRRSPSPYNVTHTEGRVGKFCLFKMGYKLGEDIIGTFDFTTAQVPCVQVSWLTSSHDLIKDDLSNHMNTNLPFLQVTLQLSYLFIVVSLEWQLHFEFVVSRTGVVAFHPPEELTQPGSWTAPRHLDIETMVWDLPIRVFPSSPLNVAQGLHMESRVTSQL